ncbi:MAG: hypothetical protein IMX00_03340 [Limnochordales bacterium]|nr:hypothetical protein [Limnochordales bacterium]
MSRLRKCSASLLLLLLFITSWAIFLPRPAQAAFPDLDLRITGEIRLRGTSYHGDLPASPPGTLPDPLREEQQREIDAGAGGIGIRQTARLQLYLYPSSGVALKVGLRHVGWWGIDRYTSGTYGAPLFLSDPFHVEELFAAIPVAAGTLYVGNQYLRFGELGLLVATPLSQEIDPTPLAAVLWESGVTPTNAGTANRYAFALAAGRLWLQPVADDDGEKRFLAHDLVAGRLSTTSAFELTPIRPATAREKTYPLRFGLNVLALGVDRERGLSIDAYLPLGEGGYAGLEAAAIRLPDSAKLALAAAGRLFWQSPGDGQAANSTRWELEFTAGGAQAGYSPLLSELRSSGGRLPFGPAEVGLQVRWRQTRGSFSAELGWEHRTPLAGTPAAAATGEQSPSPRQSASLRLGWKPPIPGLSAQVGYDHWWGEGRGYGRWLLEAAYAF